MNINYLIVEQLLVLARQEGPLRGRLTDMYKELRTNIVKTVYDQWEKTKFVYEQYNGTTGLGQRTEHFTGWTVTVVKIMAFPENP
jgi:mannosyl-oligosaccharide glucosidase